MSRGINEVNLMGNLGADPDVRTLPNGQAAAGFTLATGDIWKDRETGERKEKTEWHRISVFGKLAEFAGEHLRKGSQVMLRGKLRTRQWQGQEGVSRYVTEVVVNGPDAKIMILSGWKGESAKDSGKQSAESGVPDYTNTTPDFDGFDDDIQF